MMSAEEAKYTDKANTLIENNLSSVKITHNSRSTIWEVKVKHEDPIKAMEVSIAIDDMLCMKYEAKQMKD